MNFTWFSADNPRQSGTPQNPNIKGGTVNEQNCGHNRRAIYHNGAIINKQSDGNYSTKGHLDETSIEEKISQDNSSALTSTSWICMLESVYVWSL
jgi:hypothetical protein